ncbi:hypothetical protein J7M07_03995 [bacterium]|nr:hypothetical protein [bacterium]
MKVSKNFYLSEFIYPELLEIPRILPFDDETGAALSQHKFGRAIDVKIAGIDVLEVQLDIKRNWLYYKDEGLTTIEDATPAWIPLRISEKAKKMME